jgi:hypothetical protein
MCWASSNGVSPSSTWRGVAGCGMVRLGTPGHGPAWVAMAARRAYGPSLPPSLADVARRGAARPGMAVRGADGHGMGHRRWHGGLRPSLPPSQGWTWFGVARRGEARRGMAWRGAAWAADSSTELLRRLPAALIRGQFWRGEAGRGWLRTGEAGRGPANADDLSTGGFGSLCWVLWNPVFPRHGTALFGMVRRGTAQQGPARTDDLSTEGASLPYWAHSTHFMA